MWSPTSQPKRFASWAPTTTPWRSAAKSFHSSSSMTYSGYTSRHRSGSMANWTKKFFGSW